VHEEPERPIVGSPDELQIDQLGSVVENDRFEEGEKPLFKLCTFHVLR